MKKSVLVAAAFLCSLSACQKAKENRAAVELGQTDSLYSNILKEERKIWVHMPGGGEEAAYSPQHYPVLYLLDGESHFASVATMIQYLSRNSVCPDMIIVGIPNTDRSRDLTPTHSDFLPGNKTVDFLKTTGGGEAFTSFIEKELFPYVESHYPTAPYRMLIGHSFGGLFAANTLLKHPAMFNSYVVIDPSMWWDNLKLLNQTDSVYSKMKFNNKTMFLSIANTMQIGMDTMRVAKDTTGDSEHIRSILSFAKKSKSHPDNGLRFGYKYYNTDDHGSVPLISEYDAFRFIFDYYKPLVDAATVTPQQIDDHFKVVSQKMGYQVLPPESFINEAAYAMMSEGALPRALGFFELNAKNYPESANAFDGLGDYYSASKERTKALEQYEKSLKLKEVPATRKKLEKLRSEK